MPNILNRRIQLFRSSIAAANYDNAAHLSENLGDYQATIVLLELRGLEHRSLKGKNVSSRKNERLSGLLRHLSEKPVSSRVDMENKDDRAAATPPAPATIVVWCQQNESKSNRQLLPKKFSSCPVSEQSMDDEGNVLTWSCRWPDATDSFGIPLPFTNEKDKKSPVTLCLGLKFSDQTEIQPLGIATVNIPEIDNTILDLSVSVKPVKQRSRIFGEFGGRSLLKDWEYVTSPSTVLNIELHLTSKEKSTPIFGALVDGITNSQYPNLSYPDVTKNDSDSLSGSVSTEDVSNTSDDVFPTPIFSVNSSLEGSKGSKTSKAVNFVGAFDPFDVFTIESVDSALDCDSDIVVVPDGEILMERCTSQLADVPIHPPGVEDLIDDSVTEEAPSIQKKQEVATHEQDIPEKGGKPTVRNGIENMGGNFTEFKTKLAEVVIRSSSGGDNITVRHGIEDTHSVQEKDGIMHDEDIYIMKGYVSTGKNNNGDQVEEQCHLEQTETHAQTPMYDNLDHNTRVTIVEVKQGNSDISHVEEDLTICSFEETSNDKVPANENEQLQCHGGYEVLERLTGIKVNSCASKIDDIFDDAVDGLSGIMNCGLLEDATVVDDDDKSCDTDCMSLETFETTLCSSNGWTMCEPGSMSGSLDAISGEFDNIYSLPSSPRQLMTIK